MALNRRTFMASALAALGARSLPMAGKPAARRILTLVYDKAAGGMRAVERIVR